MADAAMERSYGCSYGCGNPYDFIFVSVSDGTTEFLCLPCFVKLAADMVEAALNPDVSHMAEALADMQSAEKAPMSNGKVRKRGKNAPATNDDPDLLEAFDSVITPEELPEEFR